MPGRLRLTVEGKLGEISFETFVAVVRNSLDILTNLDSAVSIQPRGSLDWFITEMSSGSLMVSIEARSKLPDVDYSPKVIQAFVSGLAHIQEERTTPPYFSDYDLRKAHNIARSLRKDGTNVVRVTDVEQRNTATIESGISENLSQLVNVRYQEVGSIEGRLEMISIHGSPRFAAWHSVTQHSIRCRFHAGELLQKIKEALGRRVVVYGTVHFNYQHEPIRVDVEDLDILPREEELPLPKDLRGIAPDFTGDLTTQEYLRSLRSG
jgi:hypothetical protein